jgi:hypothetical protein
MVIRNQRRIPKEGDRVGASGQNGTFEVIAVTTTPLNMVRLRLVGKPDFVIDVPWGALTFRDQEDASQAAARIAREATEDK